MAWLDAQPPREGAKIDALAVAPPIHRWKPRFLRSTLRPFQPKRRSR
jgi:hypothetical protein